MHLYLRLAFSLDFLTATLFLSRFMMYSMDIFLHESSGLALTEGCDGITGGMGWCMGAEG